MRDVKGGTPIVNFLFYPPLPRSRKWVTVACMEFAGGDNPTRDDQRSLDVPLPTDDAAEDSSAVYMCVTSARLVPGVLAAVALRSLVNL